jgi:NDP-sugar pyrophosphorylase family protein
MGDLVATAFFDLDGWDHAALFADDEPVWSALGRLSDYLAEVCGGCGTPAAPDGVYLEGDIVLGEGVVLEHGAFVRGPAVIGDRTVVRQGAYLRGDVLVGADCVVGHTSELKHSVMLSDSAAPHFNYLGDSLVGRDVNLGAGTVLSNMKLARTNVRVKVGERHYDTGLIKFGAVLGDGCQTGCHTVLNPGTVAGPRSFFYPQSCAVGYFPPESVILAAVTRLNGRGTR